MSLRSGDSRSGLPASQRAVQCGALRNRLQPEPILHAGDDLRARVEETHLEARHLRVAAHEAGEGIVGKAQLGFATSVSGHLFRTTDGGQTWRKLPHEFGETRGLAIAVT